MSSEIIFRDAASPTDPDANLLLRWENTISTPIVSASWLDDGESFSDVYTVAATSSTTVNVTSDDPKNEVLGTGITVVADDATVNYGVVPGVGLVFSSSLANGWTGKVSIGALMDSGGTTSDRFNTGIVLADEMSTQRRHAARNVGSEDSAETKVYCLPGFYVADDAQPWITTVQNHTDVARQASATPGDFEITYADYQSGSPDTADVYVNKDGGGAVKTIEDAKLDGTELYEYGSGNGYIDGVDGFLGLGIIFEANGDPSAQSHDLFVRTGFAWMEFAPDSSGSPGTWQAGPLTLTELGETTGTITAGGHAFFWTRMNVPSSATPGTRKLFNMLARGLTV
jgi:hypothetical protein